MPKTILHGGRRNSQRKYKSDASKSSSPFSTIIAIILLFVLLILLWFVISTWNRATSLPSYCNSGGCNCCNMPRESNKSHSQPPGWNCDDCGGAGGGGGGGAGGAGAASIATHPSRGWGTLDIKGIESKIKKYAIDLDSNKNFKCLFESMKAKKLGSCMKSAWPSIKTVPKHLCWRSWKYKTEAANIFEYTPCEYQSNFNIIVPNTSSKAVDEFNKWWDTTDTDKKPVEPTASSAPTAPTAPTA